MSKFKRIKKIGIENENEPENQENPEETESSSEEMEEETQSTPSKESIQESDTASILPEAEKVPAESIVAEVAKYELPDENAAESIESLGDEESEEGETSESSEESNTLFGSSTEDTLVDVDGRTFDPSLHVTNPDGSPKTSPRTGKLLKRRGRKKGIEGATMPENSEEPSDVSSQLHKGQARAAAEGYFELFKASGSVLLGEEFSEHTKSEGEACVKSIEALCMEKGSTGLTPAQMVAVTLSSYTAKRATTPTAKERLTILFLKVKKFFKRKNKEEEVVEEVSET